MHSKSTGLPRLTDENASNKRGPKLPIHELSRTICHLISIYQTPFAYYFDTLYIKRNVTGLKMNDRASFFYHQTGRICRDPRGLTKMFNNANCSAYDHRFTLYMVVFVMLRPLLTYSLLTLSITALTLFNMVT